MDKILAIFFALSIFGISTRDLVVYTHFKLDQNFIASVLCINKNKPATKCNGKCYLKKKIEQSHNKDSETKIPFAEEERTTINLYLIQKSFYKPSLSEALASIRYFELFHSFFFVKDLLKPPALSVSNLFS